MQKVEGSSPFIRFTKDPLRRVFLVRREMAFTLWVPA